MSLLKTCFRVTLTKINFTSHVDIVRTTNEHINARKTSKSYMREYLLCMFDSCPAMNYNYFT